MNVLDPADSFHGHGRSLSFPGTRTKPNRKQISVPIFNIPAGTTGITPRTTHAYATVVNPGGPLQCTIAIGFREASGNVAVGGIPGGLNTEAWLDINLVADLRAMILDPDLRRQIPLHTLLLAQALPFSWSLDDEVDQVLVDVHQVAAGPNAGTTVRAGTIVCVASWSVKTAMGYNDDDIADHFRQADITGPATPATFAL